jgi:hypothetical protein
MSTNNVQSYYKIITRTNIDNQSIVETIQVDSATYANVAASTQNLVLQSGDVIVQTVAKTKKTYYDYEMELNETKRDIILLKPDFVPQVEKEFKKVIR